LLAVAALPGVALPAPQGWAEVAFAARPDSVNDGGHALLGCLSRPLLSPLASRLGPKLARQRSLAGGWARSPDGRRAAGRVASGRRAMVRW
jgi:hypothetical protein